MSDAEGLLRAARPAALPARGPASTGSPPGEPRGGDLRDAPRHDPGGGLPPQQELRLSKSTERDSADREVAGQADVALLHELQRTADESPEARALAVRDRLWAAGGEAPLPRASVIAGQMADDQIPVIVYFRWERTFSTASVYGTACRVFTVEEDTVISTPVGCPGNTPETPHFVAEPLWSSAEGFHWPRDIEA